MRKPFFKAVVAGMASVAMIAGMSACGRSANNADSDSDAVKTIDSSKATGDLTIWAMGNEGDLLGDFVKGFEKENPDVKVKVTAIPWSSAHDKLQTAIAAGKWPRPCADGHHLDGRFLQLVLHRARQPRHVRLLRRV